MHIATSSLISLFVYFYFKSAGCALVSFLSGVLIDLDHILDFYLTHGIKKYKLFFAKVYKCDIRKVILLFHSHEVCLVSWVLIILFIKNKYFISFVIGYTQHMFFDIITNPIGIKGYSLIYRIYYQFKPEKIFKKSILERR